MWVIFYIDDILLMAESKEKLKDQASGLVYLLQCLGFTINMEKTVLEPSQSLVFLGIMVDNQDGTQVTAREIEKNQSGSSKPVGGGADHRSGASTTLGENERDYSSNSPSAPVLSPSTDGLVGGLEGSGTELQDESQPLARQQGGADLVEHSHGEVEWEVSGDQGSQPHYRLGCIKPGLGSILSGCQYRRAMVHTRENQSYQLSGDDGSHTSPEDVRKGQNGHIGVVEDRQHDSGCIHKQPRGNSVGTTGSPDPQSMDVVSREEHPHPCPTSPRLLEYGSQLGVKVHAGPVRLDAGWQYLQEN